MIILKSIRLRNFRAIREAVLKVPDKGILGLVGPNGAGKSTFLAGTLFALFGTKGINTPVGSLRRTGSGKEECSASVVFEHLGQTVEIIRELKSQNNRIIVDIYVDGAPTTHTSVGAADAWIAQRIGMDASGFLTAFIVRQKELDALVRARPGDRKAVIEKLAGIDTINDALKKARKDESAAKAILENLPGSETRIETAESQVHLLSNKVNELTEVKETKQGELQEKQLKLETINSELNSLRELEQKIHHLQQNITVAESSLKYHETVLSKLDHIKSVKTQPDLEKLREEHRAVSAETSEKIQQLNVGQVVEAQTKTAIAMLEKTLTRLNETLEGNPFVNGDKNLVEIEINETTTKKESVSQEATVLSTKILDLEEKIAALSGEHKNCPTCNTVLDDVHTLVDGFKTLADEYTQKYSEKVAEGETLQTKILTLNEKLSKILETEATQQTVKDTQASLDEKKEELNSIPDFEVLKTEISNLEVLKTEITEKGLKAKQFVEQKKEYDASKEASELEQLNIHNLTGELQTLKKQFTPEKYGKLRLQQETLQKEVSYLGSRMNEAYSDLSAIQSRLSVATNELKTAVEQWNRKKELLEAQERKALTTELIDKFRKDSIASLAPELSDRATELISAITDGAYTEIRLNETFDVAVVNANGEERDVSWLSGGEESAVAFALRLALAFLITGDQPTLLWLDEVLTAQDPERRASMLSTIRSLPIDQILVINHTEESTDILDHVVTVVPHVQKGSVVITGREIPEELLLVDELDDLDDDVLVDTDVDEDLAWVDN